MRGMVTLAREEKEEGDVWARPSPSVSSYRLAKEAVWALSLFLSPEWPPHTVPEEGMDGVYDHGHLSSSAMRPVSPLGANEEWYVGEVGVG